MNGAQGLAIFTERGLFQSIEPYLSAIDLICFYRVFPKFRLNKPWAKDPATKALDLAYETLAKVQSSHMVDFIWKCKSSVITGSFALWCVMGGPKHWKPKDVDVLVPLTIMKYFSSIKIDGKYFGILGGATYTTCPYIRSIAQMEDIQLICVYKKDHHKHVQSYDFDFCKVILDHRKGRILFPDDDTLEAIVTGSVCIDVNATYYKRCVDFTDNPHGLRSLYHKHSGRVEKYRKRGFKIQLDKPNLKKMEDVLYDKWMNVI